MGWIAPVRAAFVSVRWQIRGHSERRHTTTTMRRLVGVGAVVTRMRRDGCAELLVVQRQRDPGKGLYAVPGGKMEDGESLRQCAEREVLEETGLRIRAAERGAYAFLVGDYVVVDVRAELVNSHDEPVAASDALDARFVSAEEFARLPVSEETVLLAKALNVFAR